MPPPPPPQPQPSRGIAAAPSNSRARQLAHLQSQLAQLQANLADLEEITRVTSVQADNIKTLGTLNGALLMSAAKVLEESGIGNK